MVLTRRKNLYLYTKTSRNFDMKAPDKIYVEIRHPFGNEFTEMLGFESRGNSDDIEYIRKDLLLK